MITTPFKKQIPSDYVPAAPGLIAGISYKSLELLDGEEGVFFLRFYNCGIHFRNREEAIAKYNSLTSVKR